jgi:hypothetical protein
MLRAVEYAHDLRYYKNPNQELKFFKKYDPKWWENEENLEKLRQLKCTEELIEGYKTLTE